MPKRLNKVEFDGEVKSLWTRYLCTFGLKQAKKIVFTAYKELRRQENEQKGKGKMNEIL